MIVSAGILSSLGLRELRLATQAVEKTRQIANTLHDVTGGARDSDLAQRDFLQTGDEEYLRIYRQTIRMTAEALAAARVLLAENPIQQQRLAGLAACLQRLQAMLDHGILERRSAGRTIIPPDELADRRTVAAQIADAAVAMQADEVSLLQERRAISDHHALVILSAMILGTIVGVTLIGFILRMMWIEARARERYVQDRTAELGHAISALRQRSVELRSREEELRVLIDATPAAIAMFDLEIRYLAVSRRYRDDYRLGAQPLTGRSHYEIFPTVSQRWRDIHARCLAGATESAEEEAVPRADGPTDWVRWEIRPWLESGGTIGGIVLFSEVVTARKQAEQALAASEAQLRQAQKMEVIGQLTGGIAHDFNNILGVIIGNIEFLEDAVKGDVDQLALTTEVLNVALDGAELTRRLLTFARKQVLTPGPVDLRQYLPSLVALIRRTLGEAIRIATVTDDDLWLVRADQAQVGEALLNLVVNARDAMPQGGDLTIKASNARLDDETGTGNAEVLPGDYVMLSVTDTGTGMPPEVVERAMEPFFTTKGDATGTGLGLSMVFGFAKQSGGHLRIDSEVGLGTTVSLFLPRIADQQIEAPRAPPAIPEMLHHTASILVVDDNAAMADVARRHLTALGYTVTVALGAPAALLLLESSPPFDLLFTDVVMPDGMTGYDLAERAVRLHPGMRVLFTTGYGGGLVGTSGEVSADARSPTLRKPYRRQELAERVRSVLDTGP